MKEKIIFWEKVAQRSLMAHGFIDAFPFLQDLIEGSDFSRRFRKKIFVYCCGL